MRLPYLTSPANKTRRQIITFGGINYGTRPNDGELEESWGLSSSRYPCLAQRRGRKKEASYTSPTALYAKRKLCVVDGTDFLYDGKVVGQVTAGEKHIAGINTQVVVFPDKVYYDTKKEKFASLAASYPGYAGDMLFTDHTLAAPERSYIDQTAQEDAIISGVAADEAITVYTGAGVNKTTGALTMSGGAESTAPGLKSGDLIQYGLEEDTQYMEVSSSEVQADGTYQITGTVHTSTLYEYQTFDKVFKAGDAVEISGCTSAPENNGSHIIRSINGRTLTFDRNIFTGGFEAGTVMIERRIPDLTCVCECGNRIWGAEGSTIYASALGDPTNFYIYEGLSTDSYSAAVGTDGDFTACCAYSSTVLFWKENYLHKILGDYPAQYTIYTYTVPGVQAESEKSLAVINETLFYKGRSGVYAYAGGAPELISENFGTRRFSHAVAGTDGERYYVSMQTETGAWELYVFDTLPGIWLREDETHAVDFASLGGVLCYLDAGNNSLMMTGQDYAEEGRVDWSATLCKMDETTHGQKGYSRLSLRLDLDAGAWLKVEISPDGAPFRQVFSTHNQRAKTLQIPILPTRCDNFRIRISGKGGCVVKSLAREFSVGSEY